jgi:hypothetical protein
VSVRERFDDAATWRHFHGALTVVWMVLVPVSLVFLRESLPWIVFMSVWANVVGHFSAWQAARSEQAS